MGGREIAVEGEGSEEGRRLYQRDRDMRWVFDEGGCCGVL